MKTEKLVPNDLRIGNHVKWQGENCVIDGISREFNDSPYDVEIQFSNGMYNNEPIEEIEGITLANEWLVKFAFESGEKTVPFYGNRWFKSGISIYELDGEYIFYIELNRHYMKIKFVHELQNLFSAFGEELTLIK